MPATVRDALLVCVPILLAAQEINLDPYVAPRSWSRAACGCMQLVHGAIQPCPCAT